MEVREVESNKQAIVESILRMLPDWFGIESSTQEYIDGVVDKPLL